MKEKHRIESIMSKTLNTLNDCKKHGVYKIWHIQYPEILYIGSASSTERWREGFLQRWLWHEKHLRKNVHSSKFLQRVVNKYGIKGLRFEIIEFTTPENCLVREQHYLDTLLPFGKNGYNTCKVAGSRKGMKIPLEKRTGCIKVCQYSLEGKFIKTFPSLNEASRQTKVRLSSIMACCKKRYIQANGYQWRYFEEVKERDILPISLLEYNIITCYYLGEIKFTGKLKEIVKLTNLTSSAIYHSIKNETISSNSGWIFRKNFNVPNKINYIKNK